MDLSLSPIATVASISFGLFFTSLGRAVAQCFVLIDPRSPCSMLAGLDQSSEVSAVVGRQADDVRVLP